MTSVSVSDAREAAIKRLAEAHEQLVDVGFNGRHVVRAVAVARRVGATWQKIGDAIGMLQPNAVKKYRPLIADLEVTTDGVTAADALAELTRIPDARRKAEMAELEAVAHARGVGVTWDEIADTVGMQEPNAWVKYASLLDERRTVKVNAAARRRAGRGRRRL